MELANAQPRDAAPATTPRLSDNPVVRQLGVMFGIAASVALGVAVVLWSQTPSYSLLYGSVAQKDMPEVMQALQQEGIDYKIDEHSGAVMVPTGDVQQARLKLAGDGLPRSEGLGFELLQQDTGFGTSRLVEAARFQRALEGELSRTITTLVNVHSARVHLATPKQSVFVRRRKHPSASVVVKLYSGRVLEKGQVEAIVHLVASSVPELTPGRVTVVDHKGRLLSGKDESREMAMTSRQLEYTRELEGHYKQRIEDILAPLLGADGMRAEVTADLDFTFTEQTQERFNPDLPALRSEQVNEHKNQLSSAQGIPGALSNQPPGGGVAPARTGEEGQPPGEEDVPEPLNISTNATRNYELDKTISHTRLATGTLRRLSVAVVVDDQYVKDASGQLKAQPRTEEEISQISNLVREAIGFNVHRGDSVRVINSRFRVPEAPTPLPEPSFWEQTWFWDLIRQGGGALLVLLLVFGVLRPTMKRLTAMPARTKPDQPGSDGAQTAAEQRLQNGTSGNPNLGADGKVQLSGPEQYENVLDAARDMVSEDPKRVAQLVKQWVREEGV
jgi:flagellar M-ring protein FliF